MAIKTFKYFDAGVGFKDQAADNITTNGVIYRNGNSLKLYIESALRNIVTDTQTQTLTNKTIDADLNTISNIEVTDLKAGVLDTDLTSVSASHDTIPSAKATKDYVDGRIATVNDASEIAVVPAGTIAATNVQAAIEELDSDIQGHINDSADAHDASAISNIPSGNLAATEVQAALNELQSDIDTRRLTLENLVLTNVYHLETQAANDAATTGANASLASFSSGLIRLTNASLTSLANIPAGANGQILVVFNRTTAAFNIIDSSAAVGTAANRIFTGTGATLTMAIDSALIFQYDSTSARWQTVGGSGGGATFSDASFIIFDQADNSKQIKFDAAGTTATSTTIQSSQTANRVITLPDATDTLTANAATQTLTNKTIVAANNTITTASSGNLTSTSVNTALAELQSDIDFNRNANRILLLDASESIGTWSTGNSATFLASGAISGTLASETSTPLHGSASYKFTQAAGSLNDWFVSAAQAVDLRFRNQQTFLTFPFQYNGNTTDIQIVIYDATNSAIISSTTDLVLGTNGATSSAIVGVIIPATCASIRIGFQVKVLNSGKIFSFDDIVLSTDIFSVTNVANIGDWTSYIPTFTGFGTTTNVSARWRNVGDSIQIEAFLTGGTVQAALASMSLPSGYTLDSTKLSRQNTTAQAGSKAGTFNGNGGNGVILTAPTTSTSLLYFGTNLPSNTNTNIPSNGTSVIGNSQDITINAQIPIAGLQAYNSSVAVPTQQVSSDTMSFAFKATAINPDSDPWGTFNTYTYAINSNTATIAGTAPTQTTASMNTNGFLLYSRAYNAASTAAQPARVHIFIGKGLKSKQVDAYADLAKTNVISYDIYQPETTIFFGTRAIYNEVTGILILDAGRQQSAVTTARVGQDVVTDTTKTQAYFVFNASKSASITAIPELAPRIAYLKDIKSAGTNGGTSASAAFQTRTLNTIVDNTGIVTSLASNQFVLNAGTYSIEAKTPGYRTNQHKSRLRNITDSTTALLGTSEFSAATASYAQSTSSISGEITITSSKTFELQQYTTAAQAPDGLGVSSGTGESEVYAQVKITRIK